MVQSRTLQTGEVPGRTDEALDTADLQVTVCAGFRLGLGNTAFQWKLISVMYVWCSAGVGRVGIRNRYSC
jgi:hypothetical protein